MSEKPKRWRYWDAPLIAFVVVMVAAASITSHGTYSFFAYFLPWELALAATVVFGAGIPLLELAAVLDVRGRWRYVAGMVFLLSLEALAQYYDGQAKFVPNVQAQFPDASGIDLATFAAQPEGRVLPLLYLAALSGVVVYFGYAASARIRDLRGVQPSATMVQAPASVEDEAATEGATMPQLTAAQAQDVVYLRDVLKLGWEDIGNRLEVSRQAAQAKYKRLTTQTQAPQLEVQA